MWLTPACDFLQLFTGNTQTKYADNRESTMKAKFQRSGFPHKRAGSCVDLQLATSCKKSWRLIEKWHLWKCFRVIGHCKKWHRLTHNFESNVCWLHAIHDWNSDFVTKRDTTFQSEKLTTTICCKFVKQYIILTDSPLDSRTIWWIVTFRLKENLENLQVPVGMFEFTKAQQVWQLIDILIWRHAALWSSMY